MSKKIRVVNVEIVRAGESHVDQVAELFDAYRVFYKQPSDPERARSFIVERVANDDSVIYLARGETGGDTVALGFVQLYPSFSSVSTRRLWILNDLYVAEPGRRSGVGRALIDRARRLAIETNAKGLVLETAIDNVPAQALYHAYGFIRDEAFYRYALDL